MTLALTTRGRLCHRPFQFRSLVSWGFLCKDILEPAFKVDTFEFCQQFVFNKEAPFLIDIDQISFIPPNRPDLAKKGQSCAFVVNDEPKNFLSTTKRPSLVSPSAHVYNSKSPQLTGAKVVRTLAGREILLADPEEPTLTYSGTSIPELLEKC